MSEILKLLLSHEQYELIRAALAESPDELREKIKVLVREECSIAGREDVCVADRLRHLGISPSATSCVEAKPENGPHTSFVEPKMIELKGGTFSMGSTKSPSERPAHSVTVPAFAIAKCEVTFDEYDAFVLATGRPSGAGWGRAPQPVVDVSWNDAKAYVEWLSKVTGAPYRLPSEAEWEYAARADTTTSYWWGDGKPTPERANFGDELHETTEVGSYPANPWGLHDMNGNVWEWVEDCWHESYEAPDRPDDGRAWTSGGCSRRALRGGSWSDRPEDLRSADRFGNFTVVRGKGIGFRVARTLSRSAIP